MRNGADDQAQNVAGDRRQRAHVKGARQLQAEWTVHQVELQLLDEHGKVAQTN